MQTTDLSAASDALLAALDRDPDAPHYSEERFRRKLRDAALRLGLIPLSRSIMGASELVLAEWDAIIQDAALTAAQAEVVAMRLSGLTFAEIGERRGVTKQGAARVYGQGARRLARAWLACPIRGLAAAYEEDVRRGAGRRGGCS
jgi:hypothetical protein